MPPKKKDASCCQLNILLHHGLSAVPDKTKKVWTKSKEKISSWQFFSSVASAVKISKLSNSGSAWSAQKTSQYSLLKVPTLINISSDDIPTGIFLAYPDVYWSLYGPYTSLYLPYTILYTDCIRLKEGSLYRVFYAELVKCWWQKFD